MITKLGTVITEYSERNKAGEDIPVYSVTNEQGFCTGYFSKEVASKDRTAYKVVPRGYFAYNPSRINVGSVDWQHCEDRVIVSPLYVVFSVSEAIDQQYLLHYLKSDVTLTFIRAYATGSVRDNLKFSILSEFPINLPPVDEQRRIAGILDKIDSAIALRQEELATLDQLVKSRFIELFGNGSFAVVRADSFMFDMRNGVSPSNKGSYHAKVLTLSAITQGAFNPAACKDGLFDDEPSAEKRVSDSDFYMCRGNGNKNLVGTGVYSPRNMPDLVFPDTVIAAHIDTEKICLPYLSQAWKQPTIRNQIEAGARTTNGTYKINQSVVSSIQIPLPPLPLQKQFAIFVEQTDKSKLAVQQGLQELEIMKKALMQQYFG